MKLPLLSGRQVLSTLERMDFREVRGKGSHVKMKHPDGRKIVFPYHDEVDRYPLIHSEKCSLPDTTSHIAHATARGINLGEVESRLEGDLDVRGFPGMSDKVRNGYEKI